MSGRPDPLTPAEERWIRRLDRVLADMPRRLLIVEAGDSLTIVDQYRARNHPLHDGGAGDPEVWLADLRATMCVTGVSG